MSKTKLYLVRSFDSYDCDCCGGNWADGYELTTEDGKTYGGPAVAACFGGDHYYLEDVLMEFLRDHFELIESEAPTDEQSETGEALD